MVAKKRPEGERLKLFADEWYSRDHTGKLELAAGIGVTYDTAKHIISESGLTRKPEKKSEEPKMIVSVEELLGMRPAVNLDFVCFDIETSNLTADFSILMTACIKPFGQATMVFRADAYPEWSTSRSNDYRITKDISDELRRHAVVIGHYSSGFDIPYLRAKMVRHGLEPLPPMFGIDSWRIAKNNFQVSSRRLKNLAQFFNIGNKDSVEGDLWMKAAYDGNKEAMDKIVEHNKVDVEVLEKLACLSFPYLKSIPRL